MDNIKEQIKVEIERRIALAEKCAEAACEKNLHNALEANEMLIRQYKSLLALIDSISEEKPLEDLEEAAEEYASDYPAYNDEQAIAKYAFKRGAEWQKEQQSKKNS